MTDADRFHVPPSAGCQFCGPNFIGRCPHIPSMGVKASELSQDDVKKLLDITKPAPGVDLTPVVQWFRDELTRERNAAVEARYEVSRHRERIVELEAKLKIAETERERSRYLLEHAQCDAKEARQMLADERKRTQVPRAELTPGSFEAVKEAARLVAGDEPVVCNIRGEYSVGPWWGLSMGACKTEAANAARLALCKLLEELQPAETVANGGEP